MNGLVALVGAGEYLAVMDDIDRHLLRSVRAEGSVPNVVCLPTAAGREGEASVSRWSRMGEEHFTALGANVQALPIIDRESANDLRYEPTVEGADLIYFSGGNPMYLQETMDGSRTWAAAMKAWRRGAVYAGCSAGAMILGRRLPDFRHLRLDGRTGFGIMPVEYVVPHFDHAGPFKYLIGLLRRALKAGQTMIGIDEDTALVGTIGGAWEVMGHGRVHLLRRDGGKTYTAGQAVPVPRKGGL